MNCYDFDNTIYRGDSSCDFYRFCLRRYPRIMRHWPAQACAFIRHYVLHHISKTQMKEVFYRYFQDIPDMEAALSDFWERAIQKIQPFYTARQQPDDVIISASPEFFLRPACERRGLSELIASQVDPATGRYVGENCHGEEKVRRFRRLYPDALVEAFYSDSLSDAPMARLAERAYLVKGTAIENWHF